MALVSSSVFAQCPMNGPTNTLFFSEYVEGSGFNKALEIFNGTGVDVDLSTYTIERYANGSISSASIPLVGTLLDGDVFVIATTNSGRDAAIMAVEDQTSGSISHNGDDAYELRNGVTLVDSFGQVGNDPGSAWTGGGISTANQTLRRKDVTCSGDSNSTDAFDPSIEWDGFPNDTFDNLGLVGGFVPVELLNFSID